MKIKITENEFGLDIDMTPETPFEVSQLARVVKNARAEKPIINLYFSDTPSCNIWIRKIKASNQRNYISNE